MVAILLFKFVVMFLLFSNVSIEAVAEFENCEDLKDAVVDLTEENAYLKNCIKTPYTYKVTPTSMSWQDAQAYCVKQGGSLAVHGMRGLLLQKRIEIFTNYTKPLWIGANDLDTEGVWTWLDGEKVTTDDMHWLPGEPNNSQYTHTDGEDCAFMSPSSGFKVNDAPCKKPIRPVYGLCEISNCLYSTLTPSGGGDLSMLMLMDAESNIPINSTEATTTTSAEEAGNASDSKYTVNFHILFTILFYSLISFLFLEL